MAIKNLKIKNTETVSALKFTPDNSDEIEEMLGDVSCRIIRDEVSGKIRAVVLYYAEGNLPMQLTIGNWLMKDSDGNFWVESNHSIENRYSEA